MIILNTTNENEEVKETPVQEEETTVKEKKTNKAIEWLRKDNNFNKAIVGTTATLFVGTVAIWAHLISKYDN